MRTLLIDNYDSFTYNVFQLLAEVNGVEPTVVRNDELSWPELRALAFDNVVLSPGPGSPDRPGDFGVCADLIRECRAPLLGICLGFQGLCSTHGAAIAHAPEPMHGRLSPIRHDGSPLFAGIAQGWSVVRYHSLAVSEPLPASLCPLAHADDGVLMAVAHRELPQWGVQFHPESVCTAGGGRLLANFRQLSEAALGGAGRRGRRAGASSRAPGESRPAPAGAVAPPRKRPLAGLRVRARRLELAVDPEAAFVALYGEAEHAFWLDGEGDGRSRFSFLGDAAGPRALTVAYDAELGELSVSDRGGTELRRESIFDFLRERLAQLEPASIELPFELGCGFVGYLGYELKAECGGEAAHRSDLPDAAFVLADRLLAFDRGEDCVHLVCLAAEDGDPEADRWLAETAAALRRVCERPPRQPEAPAEEETRFRLSRPRERHLEDVAECQHLLREGETYEACLTNRLLADTSSDSLSLYRRLRRHNPAPYSAYLRFGAAAILSSSPERFLRVERSGLVEARPMKGTAARAAEPTEDAARARALCRSEKERAENLMITDLMRNDLGAVCEAGSIEVPQLIGLESYETVHQLVSVIRGRLRDGFDAVSCVRACFPPGSMTGAPKLRTMEILDRLEGEARGVYSGALGYFGLGGGCDLSVVIRTVVLAGGRAAIGIGGGVVMQSDPHDEYQESLLKGRAPMEAINPRARVETEPLAGGWIA